MNLNNWPDSAHMINPELLQPNALEDVALIPKERQFDIITVELLEAIKEQYLLDWFGTHGIFHWHRVHENGIRLSSQEGVNPKVVQLFSVLHDACRKNEYKDHGHGKRGAELALKLRDHLPLNDNELALLVKACELHTGTHNHENITIQSCWDTDRLDLGRVGKYPNPDLLCTNMAKDEKVIAWAYHKSMIDGLPDMPFGLSGFDHDQFK
jgi:uncharacterized protein